MKPLSADLRRRIVAARERGDGTGEVCRRFKVSRRSVERLWNQFRRQGHLRPRRMGGYRRSRLAGHDQALRRWIAAEPGLTLAQLQARCAQVLRVPVRQTALWHRLARLGLTYKKTLRAAEQDPPDVKAARRRWRCHQPRWNAQHLVFVDETCLNTRLARHHGRAPHGQRGRDAVPRGHWHTSTFIAALAALHPDHCQAFFRPAHDASI